jgi:hypothetical protein
VIVPADYSTTVTNPFYPLAPGMKWQYLEKKGRDEAHIFMEVLRTTRLVMGVRCVVVQERMMVADKLKEESSAWYAQHQDGSVWFFGEAIQEHKPGGRISDVGSWEAGINGAQAGVVMPSQWPIGMRFRQNYCRNVAEDMGEIIALAAGVRASVPAGEYTGCLRLREWSMLASGSSKKWFAKGVGLVRTEALDGETTVLVTFTKP